MPRPVVALIGRPNTGKSTLFNRLLGRRQAIVDAQPGLTRDRIYGLAEWNGREFNLVDTAGLDLGSDESSRSAIEAQTRVAIEEAEVIVLMFDVRQGVTAVDRDIVQMLRRAHREVVAVANKADHPGQEHFRHEIVALGLGEPVLISGQHGLGIGDLLDAVCARLPPPIEDEPGEASSARIAIMGRPNVGKSSLLNRLLGDERALVSDTPGTTRDPIDTEIIYDGLPVTLVDTAGIRRRSAARDRAEHFSLLRGIKAMERADAVLLVMDATEGVLNQDQHVAGYALESGKGLVLVVNKIDLMEAAEKKQELWRRKVLAEFRFFAHAPVLTISAQTGEGVERLLPATLEVIGQRRVRIPTNHLNRALREAFAERPPPSFRGKRLSFKYATQAASEAPTFVLFVNDVNLLHFSYRRYLENQIRLRYGFAGNPLKIVLRSAKPEA